MSQSGLGQPRAVRFTARTGLMLSALALLALLWLTHAVWGTDEDAGVVHIGILHALTGPMAISEKPMVQAEQLAIDEINAQGGVLGRKVVPVIADTASNTATTAAAIEHLFREDQVSSVIGCWTSACRKTVKPIVERHAGLLIYPMAYEGLEISPNIIYTGAAPNQQVLPAVNWSFENLGRRVFLVGSDYIWPHTVNAIISDQLKALGGEVVGETYITFGSLDPTQAIQKIRDARPDVILSTVAGDSNAPFYRALRAAGLTAKTSPVVAFAVSETELQSLPLNDLIGHYAAWGYFQTIDRPENQAFLQRFRAVHGSGSAVSDVVETAYFSTHLWARGVKRANSLEPADISQAMLGLSYDAPEGIVTVDPSTRHTWRAFNMGQVREDGSIQIVWSADYPIRPVPYPRSRSFKDWDGFLNDLFAQWNNSWINLPAQTHTPGQP